MYHDHSEYSVRRYGTRSQEPQRVDVSRGYGDQRPDVHRFEGGTVWHTSRSDPPIWMKRVHWHYGSLFLEPTGEDLTVALNGLPVALTWEDAESQMINFIEDDAPLGDDLLTHVDSFKSWVHDSLGHEGLRGFSEGDLSGYTLRLHPHTDSTCTGFLRKWQEEELEALGD